jgi:hypothetical protein
VENNYNLNIPKCVDANYLKTSMYDDTWVNVLEEALLIQTNHKNKRIKKKKKFKHKSYDYEDSAKLIQILFTTYVFNKIKRNIIIKCP